MCSRCHDAIDEQLYHYTYIWVRCGCRPKPYRVYTHPERVVGTVHAVCGVEIRRVSDPRIHRSVKRPIVLHERTLKNGQIDQWAPFTPDTPPPHGARIREVSSIRELERLAAAGEVHDLLKYDEAHLDRGLDPSDPGDPELSEEQLVHEELTMRQQLGLPINESSIRESIADTMAPSPVPIPGIE